jgi:uncharacterized protein YjiS (DUF1127 family)
MIDAPWITARSARPAGTRLARISTTARRMWSDLGRQFCRWHTARILRQLDDHALKDIGLSRSDIDRAASKCGPRWRL